MILLNKYHLASYIMYIDHEAIILWSQRLIGICIMYIPVGQQQKRDALGNETARQDNACEDYSQE